MTKKRRNVRNRTPLEALRVIPLVAGSPLGLFFPYCVAAQTTSAPDPAAAVPSDNSLQEVIVTATRRATDVIKVPYNISAVGSAELAQTNTSTLAQLANYVPGFSLEDRGARFATASIPIIRGLNASNTERNGLIFEQMPVATYIDNSPVTGYFPFDDVQRIEVLRGPQGTLYGAGSLGGTIRIIPNEPQLNAWSGNVEVGGSATAHSTDPGYSASALFNIPLTSIAALRISGKYEHESGFIDQEKIVKRSGDYITGTPVLANPGDIAGSPPVYYDMKDMNYTDTRSARASLRIQPNDALKIELALNYSSINGFGGPQANPAFTGGPAPFDPAITFPPSGPYTQISPTLQPYTRPSELASLDVSYDAGFATLSSTTTYDGTEGNSATEATYSVFTLPASFRGYYVGNPVSPRFVDGFLFHDGTHTFTQELRLVSNLSGPIDYVAGAFYETQGSNLSWNAYSPGVMEQAIASGGQLVTTGPNGWQYTQTSLQLFKDKSVYGEATWHITSRWQLTGGARLFWQDFTAGQDFYTYLLAYGDSGSSSSTVHDHIFKVNTAYEFAENQQVYATYSQGFRRGGTNAVPLVGALAEPLAINSYKPDTADNYELGVKGRIGVLRYSADLFFIDWKEAQVGTSTPNGTVVVVNAPVAHSRGFELELHTPLIVPQLEVGMGYSFARATLAQSFCLPVGDGAGGVTNCGISGVNGSQLPGSPESSGSLFLVYTQALRESQHLTYSVSTTYKSSITSNLPTVQIPVVGLPAYAFLNGSVTYDLGKITLTAFGTNLLDHRAIYAVNTRRLDVVGSLGMTQEISRPRELGLKVAYNW